MLFHQQSLFYGRLLAAATKAIPSVGLLLDEQSSRKHKAPWQTYGPIMNCASELVILARFQLHHEGIWTYRGVNGYGKQRKVVPHHEDLLTNCPTLVFFRAELIYLLFLLLSITRLSLKLP